MKKKLFFISVLIFSSAYYCMAQEKMDKFCEVILTPKNGFSSSLKVEMNFGNPNTYFKDSTVKKNLLAVNKFNNPVDVLDHMSNLGWTLVSNISYGIYTAGQIFYFKKTFDRSEFIIDGKN